MLPDRVSNPGPLTYESGALPIALRGPANTLSGSIYCIRQSHRMYYRDVLKFLLLIQERHCQLLTKGCAQSTG